MSRQYHLGVRRGEVAPNLILVGDPERAIRAKDLLDRVDHEISRRGIVTITGELSGMPVSIVGTGMGAANTEIAVVELAEVVEDPIMIRCGSTGALRPPLSLGDLVVTTGAVRLENTSLAYVDPGYPAVADYRVVDALVRVAKVSRRPVHTGITATASGFYGAQGRTDGGFTPLETKVHRKLASQGVLNLEMEASCLLTLASIKGIPAGVVCAVYACRYEDTFIAKPDAMQAEKHCLRVGLAALAQVRGG